jgi:hypothetical protein
VKLKPEILKHGQAAIAGACGGQQSLLVFHGGSGSSLEEIHENKEQIEISKAYEKMPNPSLLATQEFMEDKVYYRRSEDNLFI